LSGGLGAADLIIRRFSKKNEA